MNYATAWALSLITLCLLLALVAVLAYRGAVRFPVFPAEPFTPPTAYDLIATERSRQINDLGYDLEHDKKHGALVLAGAAVVYCDGPHRAEHWPEGWTYKPENRLRDLIKAGALYDAAAAVARSEGNTGFEIGAIQSKIHCVEKIEDLIDAVMVLMNEVTQ